MISINKMCFEEDVMPENIQQSKCSTIDLFVIFENINLFIPKFYLLGHIGKGVSRFSTLKFFDAFSLNS